MTFQGEREGGGINWEIGVDKYTLSIQQVTNTDLQYSTGNTTQNSIMTYVGKQSKRVDICITDSLC